MSEETYSKRAARAAYGWGRKRDWDAALELIEAAAKAGEPGAARQVELVTQEPIATLLEPPSRESLSHISSIFAVRGFMPAGFSEWLIDKAKDRLFAAPVIDASGEAVRTALGAAFGPQERDLVLAIVQIRAARLIGARIPFHEPPNVLSYEPGQEFRLHVDFINPDVPEFEDHLAQFGQRDATIVTYLNDDFDGAETYFPNAGVKFRGATGDAIAFSNLLPDGTPDVNTVHCALPPTRGRKWVLSQWFRTTAYPYPPEEMA